MILTLPLPGWEGIEGRVKKVGFASVEGSMVNYRMISPRRFFGGAILAGKTALVSIGFTHNVTASDRLSITE